MRIANVGAREALKKDPGFAEGLNTYQGKVTYRGVAESQQREWTAASQLLS
jgi:alanine dehydrogenase